MYVEDRIFHQGIVKIREKKEGKCEKIDFKLHTLAHARVCEFEISITRAANRYLSARVICHISRARMRILLLLKRFSAENTAIKAPHCRRGAFLIKKTSENV